MIDYIFYRQFQTYLCRFAQPKPHNYYCNLNNVELELKIKLDEDEWNKLQKFIKSNSTYLGDENHSAVYYYPEHRELESEWLRVRNQNGTFVLN